MDIYIYIMYTIYIYIHYTFYIIASLATFDHTTGPGVECNIGGYRRGSKIWVTWVF